MRNLVYAINTTLDGCIDHTKFYPDEETFAYVTQLTWDAGTFLYGRIKYFYRRCDPCLNLQSLD
ncbi:MAG: dihydrofolate reductase [Mucilaginibacter sp.]|nr:dihydrofolate reductase [Mucilaginibacter sp.]